MATPEAVPVGPPKESAHRVGYCTKAPLADQALRSRELRDRLVEQLPEDDEVRVKAVASPAPSSRPSRMAGSG